MILAGIQIGKDNGSLILTVAIILSVEEPIDSTQYKGRENCHNGKRCKTHNLWSGLNIRILDYLTLITLEQLITNPKVKNIATLQDQMDFGKPEHV